MSIVHEVTEVVWRGDETVEKEGEYEKRD